MQSLVPKARRAKFEFTLLIHDLNNVPLVSGSSFIKWHLPSSTAAEHRGRTPKAQIRDHKVNYDYSKSTTIRLTVGKDGMLQECGIEFEVIQEYSAGGRGERIKLGEVRLNLAEYVEASEALSPSTHGASREGGDEHEGVVRRYLMQESKINSTLKIGIHMRHIDGTRDYDAPPLRTAPVFGGIAGIIHSSEPTGSATGLAGHVGHGQEGEDNAVPVPSLMSSNKELGEMQDMYRRTLAAYWSSQPGELRADECIEDIFAGGDGWGKIGRPESSGGLPLRGSGGDSTPEQASHHHHHHHRRRDEDHNDAHGDDRTSHWHAGAMRNGGVMHRSSIAFRWNQQGRKPTNAPRKSHGEIDEFDIREDLRSWRISESAYG